MLRDFASRSVGYGASPIAVSVKRSGATCSSCIKIKSLSAYWHPSLQGATAVIAALCGAQKVEEGGHERHRNVKKASTGGGQ